MFAGPASPGLRLVQDDALTSANAPTGEPFTAANMVEAAVAAEIVALGEHNRSGLEATALALARILDNPKAISTQPAAARQLVAILDELARGSHRRGKLAVVKSMTSSGNG